jgi:ribosomal protein L11 methyltransferase
MDLETLNPDAVEAVLTRHGARSITFTDAGGEPVLEPAPGEAPLWPQSRIAGLFGADVDFDLLTYDLQRSLEVDALPSHHVEPIEDRQWEREWLKGIAPMRFGERLWICPGNTHVDLPGIVTVRLDPGLAFGTGTHPTTALCLEWLARQALAGQTLLDYGCGSGILAIAALKLGCRSAWAFDIDEQAITATRQNAGANAVAARLRLTGDSADISTKFDVVVANILARPLIDNAGSIADRVVGGGSLALSGILAVQVDELIDAYRAWIEFGEPVYRTEAQQCWAIVTGRKFEK